MRWTWDTQDLWIDPAKLAAGRRPNTVTGTSGDDDLYGTRERDTFKVGQGGDDVLHGKGGRDVFQFDNSFTHSDMIFGGAGTDTVAIAGRYNSLIELDPTSLHSVELVRLEGGPSLSYTLVIDAGFNRFRVDGHDAGSTIIDGSSVDGELILQGGLGGDTLQGGSDNDRLIGAGGGDSLRGGLGADHFIYTLTSDSDDRVFSSGADLIEDFSEDDVLHLPSSNNLMYHIGSTQERVGDVIPEYDPDVGRTILRIFTNKDDSSDMTIFLIGDKSHIEITDGSHIVLIGS